MGKKRSQRRVVHYENDQLGCMWGFINMFDFRRGGSPHKMISNRRRENHHFSGKHNILTDFVLGQDEDIDDHIERSYRKTGDGKPKPSVKKLIEEEMFSDSELARTSSSVEVDEKYPQSEPESGSKKNHKKTNKIRNKSKESDTLGLDLNPVIDELCAQIKKKNISAAENSNFQEMVREAAMVFFSEKNLKSDGKIHDSEELMATVESLISNKLFMEKLRDDPNTLVKQIQTLEETMADTNDEVSDKPNSEDFENRKKHSFFQRKSKSVRKNSSEENEISLNPNRIVILKPATASLQDCDETESTHGSSTPSEVIVKHDDLGKKNVSQFSFTELKRKLKKAMGMKVSGTSKNSLPNRFPHINGENVGRKSPSRDFYTEKFPKKLSTSPKFSRETTNEEKNSDIITENETENSSGNFLSNMSIEARKHLSEMLSNDDAPENLSTKQVPKILQIDSGPSFNIHDVINHDISDKLINNEDEVIETICSKDDLQVIQTIDFEVKNHVLESEPSSSLTKDDQNNDTLTSPSRSPIILNVERLESEIDKTGRPSPVSVLDRLFLDGDISPESSISPPAELSITPLRIQFEEHDSPDIDHQSSRSAKTRMEDLKSIFEYCETLLQTSGICWEELYIKSLSSNQLLDPTLLEEIMFFSNPLCYEQKLLFDCINEVLMEMCDYYFGPTPWVSFVEPNIKPTPNMENTINEVCEGVEWNLTSNMSPRSLEQIVMKDLAKKGKWVDIRFDMENICAEINEIIFNELIENVILNFKERNVGDDFVELEAELKEIESSINA